MFREHYTDLESTESDATDLTLVMHMERQGDTMSKGRNKRAVEVWSLERVL